MASTRSVSFHASQELDLPLRVKIGSLQGGRPLARPSERIVRPALSQKGSAVFPHSDLLVSVQVIDKESGRNLTLPRYTPYTAFRDSRVWDHWLTLPISLKQLSLACRLKIVLWEYDGQGKVPFYVAETDIFNAKDNSLKNGVYSIRFQYDKPGGYKDVTDDLVLDSLNKYSRREIDKVEWLDRITIPQLLKTLQERAYPIGTFELFLEFPIFENPVVYTDLQYTDTQKHILVLHNMELNNGNITSKYTAKNHPIFSALKFYDPDQFLSDPIQEKFRRLERASKRSTLDKQAKPDASKRDYLNRLINYPPGTKLTAHEKGSIWKYRYYLMNNKKALTKLLQSTNLTEETERTEVLELMDSWAEIDIDDAIELLGSNYKNISVRAYAVNRLKKASDRELELYLLQLVQAVCFESLSTFSDKSDSEFTIVDMLSTQALETSNHHLKSTVVEPPAADSTITVVISPLAEFLIRRAITNARLGSFFFWYLKTESTDNTYLKQILDSFWSRLDKQHQKDLKDQILLLEMLREICIDVKRLKDTTAKKTELLQNLLTFKLKDKLKSNHPHLPLDPDVVITGVDVEASKVFKSTLSPLKITFKTKSGILYPIMYKVGDDLRQDQLVVQIITLMNELLKNENVDLKLQPYKILAAGPQEGAIQFIPNETMASILATYHGILPYLRLQHPDTKEELGVQAWVMDNFVKSCAGYCVITYILGVGDRHLDNLLISPDGHFFHADFGYILGQDPKPFPPLMKLPPQIIEAFGGPESSNYNKFRSYCFVAYSILRRNAGLILNLFELMKTSNIPDIRIDPDGAILRVNERFNLDMSEEEATIHFQTLINDSVNALLPIVIDHLHNLAQYWRA